MGASLLFEGRLRRYCQQYADSSEALWFFQHLTKTAGSSFRTELAKVLQPDLNIGPTRKVNGERITFGSLQASIDHLVQSPELQQARFASGHLNGEVIRQIGQHRENMRLITMLREPFSRVLSLYRYLRTPAHPHFERIRAEFPAFESFIEAPVYRNGMFRALRIGGSETPRQVIDRMERHYCFVGLTEHYELSRQLLFHLLGQSAPQRVLVKNRTEDIPENRQENPEDLRSRVLALNAADAEIHEHFAERFQEIAPNLQRYLSRNGALLRH